jgi:O-antigen/teichoic acid export membrane protein
LAERDLKTTTIKSLFWKLFEQGGTAVVTLVVQVVMARLLAPAEFGVLAIMLVFVNVGNVIVQSGLNTAIIHDPDVTERDYSTVFWMSFTISVVLYLAVFVFSPAIAGFYQIESAITPLRVLVLVLIVNSYNSIQEAIVARNFEFQKTSRATWAAAIVSGVAGVWAANAGAGLWALVIQQLLQQITKCTVLALQVPWKPQLVFDRARAVVLFRFGWKLLASGVMDQAYQSLSSLFIGAVFNKTDLGYVDNGKKYPYYLGAMLDGTIQPVMLSAVSSVQDNIEHVKRLTRRALKTSTFVIIPSMTAFALVAEPLVLILFGEKWLPCVPFLRMYCFIYALLPIHTTNLQVLNGMGRSDLFLKLEVYKKIIGLSIMCFTVFVMRDLYVIVGGYIINGIIATFINAAPNKKVIGYSYAEQIRDILPAFGLAAVAAVAAAPLSGLAMGPLAMVLVQCVVFSVVYLAVAAILRVEEFTYLVNTAMGFVRRRKG